MATVLTLVIPEGEAETIGQRLRIARGRHSQETLAAAIGVTARTLRNWEHDTHSPTVDGVKAVARATGMSAAWLFGVDENDDGRTPDGGPATHTLYAPWDLNPEPADMASERTQNLNPVAA